MYYPVSPMFYSLSLHDALPIWQISFCLYMVHELVHTAWGWAVEQFELTPQDNPWKWNVIGLLAIADDIPLPRIVRSEGTRLNSSHANISYAVFCLKKKKKKNIY